MARDLAGFGKELVPLSVAGRLVWRAGAAGLHSAGLVSSDSRMDVVGGIWMAVCHAVFIAAGNSSRCMVCRPGGAARAGGYLHVSIDCAERAGLADIR